MLISVLVFFVSEGVGAKEGMSFDHQYMDVVRLKYSQLTKAVKSCIQHYVEIKHTKYLYKCTLLHDNKNVIIQI